VKKGLKPLRKFKTFNAVICRWYVEKLKEFWFYFSINFLLLLITFITVSITGSIVLAIS
jgi:hypothetical protein